MSDKKLSFSKKFIMINQYKKIITSREYVNLEKWEIPFFDLSKIEESLWYKPYGDSSKDIYKENAIRSSTLNEDIKSKLWTGLVLKNQTGNFNDTFIDNVHANYDNIKDLIITYRKFKGKWTSISDKIKPIKSFFEKNIDPFLCVGHVYILKIGPEGFIKEHRDIPDNYDENIHKNYNTLNTFFCPLNDPVNSYFLLNKKQVDLQTNKVTWFNSSLPHVYFNTSREDKYFLIFTGLARKPWINMTVSNVL